MNPQPSFIIREFIFPDDYQQVYACGARQDLHSSSPSMNPGRSLKLQRDPDLFLVAQIEHLIVGTVLGG
jgi:hypothetical protein